MTTDQKELAGALDQCAARAHLVGATPATARQNWYLAGLMVAAGDDGDRFFLDTSYVLTRKKASELIEFYRKETNNE